MKQQRHSAIRDLLVTTTVTSQDELRKKLAKRGFNVTQATLSRDMRELNLYKGPNGYTLASAAVAEDDRSPEIDDLLSSFGLEVRQAMNQVVIITTTGGAQPVAAALDYEDWEEIVGTIAGDDTVLVICGDIEQAKTVTSRIAQLIG